MRIERRGDFMDIDIGGNIEHVLKVAEALRLARWIIELAGDGPVQNETCAWEYWAHGEYWETGCDNAFVLNDGTPKENGMIFCPYCSHRIEEVEG